MYYIVQNVKGVQDNLTNKKDKQFNLMDFRKKLIANQQVIIKYLEGRVAELNVLVDAYKKLTDDDND